MELQFHSLLPILLLLFASAKSEVNKNTSYVRDEELGSKCNLFSGEWIYNSSLKPLYDSSSCPYIDSVFDCLKFGRPDKEYLKYSWKPSSCTLPRQGFFKFHFRFRFHFRLALLCTFDLGITSFGSFICVVDLTVPIF